MASIKTIRRKFQRLVELHIDWPWNFYELSQNSNITPEFVDQHPDWPWKIDKLSQNSSITSEFIERHGLVMGFFRIITKFEYNSRIY